ncbi:sorbosone dehydrogenase family protein, partial [Persicitalea sp.]|uniref:PQQ-dependent sugar dehydrogenase n=1 Tax=Persicitalea sp. TaxID=3100273 RepID=UPI0035940FC0
MVYDNRKFLLGVAMYSYILSPVTYAQVPDLTYEVYVSGLTRPTDIAAAQDGRLYVSEIGGNIRIIDQEGMVLPSAFLSIGYLLKDQLWDGVFGIVFHPNYTTNRYFFVKYIRADGYFVVSRFRTDATNPNYANPNTEQVVLAIPYDGGHRGGDIAFGADGYLYIPTGDGSPGGRGEIGDLPHLAQNLTSIKGKILRIDVDGASPYRIPASNPYQTPGDGIPDEIWGLGLRNPWRISFDRQTGDGWIGDNGQDGWEEVDFFSASHSGGINFGWSCYEGTHAYASCPQSASYTNPVFEYPGYDHNGGQSASVVGGYVYRGQRYPSLWSWYIFADYASGHLMGVSSDSTLAPASFEADFTLSNPVSFG